MSNNLKDKTANGLLWGLLNNGSVQVLNVLFGILLARKLTPGDFGVTGVLVIFSTIASTLQDSGFTQGLINLKAPSKKDYDSVFWFNIAVSVSLYAVLFACAPLLASFFNMPCLVEVSRVTFLSFVIAALSISSGAYLKKNLMNREIAITGVTALLVSGIVGVAMAFMNLRYWALVGQQMTYISVITMMRFWYCRWLPSLKIDFRPVRRMMGFGLQMMVTNIVGVLSQYVLTIFIGHRFPSHQVGNYTQANKWNLMASQTVSGTMNQLAQAVLVEVTDDRERQLRVFRKMLRFAAFLAMPAMLGLSLVSHEFIVTLLGQKWVDCASMMQVLCVGGAFLSLYSLYQNLAVSSGRGRTYMWLGISQMAAQIAVIIGFAHLGVMPMIMAYTALTILWLGVWQGFARHYIGMTWTMLLRDVSPYLLTALCTMAATHFATLWIDNLWVLLIARIAMAATLYFAAMFVMKDDIMQEIIQRRKAKKQQ